MDHWHAISVRANESGAIRRWATLEGKSATTREDLVRRVEARPRRKRLIAVANMAEVAAAMVHAYLHIRSR
ncbi:MAG TPA: hypothetical protein VFW73_01485 [Lacipirellulaceae bacterium]|nr:hypothetical protein [Lacipirellulaceae bacterium]